MVRTCGEDVVAQSASVAIGDPDWVVEKGFEARQASLVEVG
jgi:hypothetical protein